MCDMTKSIFFVILIFFLQMSHGWSTILQVPHPYVRQNELSHVAHMDAFHMYIDIDI